MRLKSVFVISLFMAISAKAIAADYRGQVFVDSNRNGVMDSGEKPLSDVVVSDGLNVVRTDKSGNFLLPGHDRERFIFITTPSGYKTDNAYYHKIEGACSEYNFALTPYNSGVRKDGSHRFVHISDTEIGSAIGNEDWVQNLRDYVATEGAAFIIHTGDICYEGGLNSHIKMMNTKNMDTQMFYSIGNHDLVKGETGEALFEKLYGPVYYSFDVGSVHYVVTPMPNGDYAPSYTKDDVYQWLKNDLAEQNGRPVVIFNHDLLTRDGNFIFDNGKGKSLDLDSYNLKAWVYGHWHINHISKHKSAYSVCTSTLVRGGIDHASSGFRIFDFDGEGNFSTELRYTYLDKRMEIASISDLQAPLTGFGQVPLSVNVYSTTSPTCEVSCTISSGREVYGRAITLTQKSDFNWYADLQIPKELDGELVTLSVEARYSNGEISKINRSFIYNGEQSSAKLNKGGSWRNMLGSASRSQPMVDSLAAPLSLAWVKNVGANIYMSSPLVDDGRVYVATIDEDNKGRSALVAMDAVTGKRLWSYRTKGSVRNSIAIDGDNIFAQDVHGNLYAVDKATGALVWSTKLNIDRLPALNDGLVAEDGVVYAGSGMGLSAYDSASGEMLWQNSEWRMNEGTTASLSLNNNVLIGHAHWGALYANDAKTGKLLWTLKDDGLRNRSAAAAMRGDLIYLASKSSFFIISASKGEVLVRRDLGYNVDVNSTPLVTDSEIIFGTADRGVVALDRATLDEKWNFMTSPSLIYSSPYTRNPSATVETSPILSGDQVYIAASDGNLYSLDRLSGSLIWKHSCGAPIFATPSLAGGYLYIVDFSGNVYAFTNRNN